MAYFCLILCFNTSLIASPVLSQKNEAKSKKTALKKNCDTLVLYINPRCPYCHKVTDYLKANGRSLTTKNTDDPGVREELIRTGGKAQIPCLVINGKALYESDAIIEWLKTHP
jgi:glutaredoxin